MKSIKLFATLVGVLAIAGGALAQKSSTGQGIQVTLTGGGAYTYTATDTYRFNKVNAAAYYNNALVSGPEISASGNPDVSCGPTFEAATPSAPAPDASVVEGSGLNGANGLTGDDRCTFLDGGSLSSATYTQKVTISVQCGVNNSGKPKMYNVTYTWTYLASPNVESVAPWTCWDLVSSVSEGSADVSIGGQVAGESAQSSKQHPLKYSFSLHDDLGGNRVTNLVVTMNGNSFPTTSTIVTGVDFTMSNFNAGTNGNTSLLKLGDARTILNTDSFAGNNNGGSDSKALAFAEMAPVTFYGLSSGDYNVQVTGTVKGNAAAAQTDFSVSTLITVVTPGCGGG